MHGAGDGSTTFNVPDLRGIVTAGLDNMGGSNANRLSSVLTSSTLGASGGGQLNNAPISIGVSGSASGTLSGGYAGGPLADAAGNTNAVYLVTASQINVSGTLGVSGTAAGTSGNFSITQPTRVMNKVIRI